MPEGMEKQFTPEEEAFFRGKGMEKPPLPLRGAERPSNIKPLREEKSEAPFKEADWFKGAGISGKNIPEKKRAAAG